nr:head maturation protease, ClpP-related [Paenibacillus lupini]
MAKQLARKEVEKVPKTVNIKGVIVGDDEKWIYDWFEIAATSPGDVQRELNDANGEAVDVFINSGGGSVFAGSEIYSLIKAYRGKTIGKIVGLAASAASVGAMGCDTVQISPTAQIMIHNVWSYSSGDYRDMQHTSDVLKNMNTSIANAYRLKTNLEEQELLDMMDKETWLSAQQALEKGFADEIMFDSEKKLAASTGGFAGLLPPEVMEKMRAHLKAGGAPAPVASVVAEPQVDEMKQRQYAAKLNLLKLRSVDL